MIPYRVSTASPQRPWDFTAVQLHVQCHAFASRLYKKRIVTDDMLMVQAMREAFEVVNPEENIHLTLVAVYSWLKRDHDHFVNRISGQHRKRTTYTGNSESYSTGELYHAQGGLWTLDKARWNFWKDRFLELTQGRYKNSHKLRKAAQKMHRFEDV